MWQPVTREKYLHDDELVQIFEWINQHEDEPRWRDPAFLVRFVLGTGLRVSEIPPLIIGADVSPEGIIQVRRAKTGRRRQVRMSPELYPFFKRREETYLHASPARKAALIESGLLFPRRNGGGVDLWGYKEGRLLVPLSIAALQSYWYKVLAEAGIRKLGIHSGRHTYATFELASKRLTFHEVQAQLGHSSEETTREVYAHVVVEMLYESRSPNWWEVALRKIKNGRE